MRTINPRCRAARLALALTLATVALSPVAAGADDWTRFRGPNGSGLADGGTLPKTYGDDALLWSAEVPFGRSSPVLTEDRLFLTGIAADRLATLAISRQTGELLWWRSIERERQADLYRLTDSSTPSPVTDGENVYAFFHEAGLVSYDGEGRERWRVDLGHFRNYYGIAASPILVGDLVIQLCDQAGGSFIVAVDRDSGEEVWRQSRARRRESYSTPVLYPDATDPRMILVSGSKALDAYDPATGAELWSVGGLGTGPVASAVVAGERVYVVAPNHAETEHPPFASLLAERDTDGDGRLGLSELDGHWGASHLGWLDLDADGLLTASEWEALIEETTSEGWGLFGISLAAEPPSVIWNYNRNPAYVPTPIVVDGVVYMAKDSILTALDAATGEVLERGRLETNKVYGSPVAAGGLILLPGHDGRLNLVRAGRDWEIVATHDLEEEIWAAPALGERELFLRTRRQLHAFSRPAAQTSGTSAPAAQPAAPEAGPDDL